MPLSNENKENLLRILLNSLVVPFILSVVVRNGQSFGRRRDEPLDHHGNTATVRLPQTNRPPARTSHPPTIYRPATTRTSCHCAVCRLFGACVLAASSAVAALVTYVLVASRAVAARRAHGCSPKCRDRARGSAHHQPASRHKLPHRHRLSRCLFFSQPIFAASLLPSNVPLSAVLSPVILSPSVLPLAVYPLVDLPLAVNRTD